MKKLYVLFAGLLFCVVLQSQVSQLINPLLSGGKIRGYAKNATSVLICTDGGLFRTTDGGMTWANATQSFNPISVKSQNVMILGNDYYAESDTNTGVSIYKSTDNGNSWTLLSPLIFSLYGPQSLGKMSNTLYLIGINQSDQGTQTGELLSSTDGINWVPNAQLWSNNNQGSNCRLMSFNQNNLYIFVDNNIYYTSDGTTLNTLSLTGLGISGFNGDSQSALMGDALGNLYYYQDGMNAIFKYNFTTGSWSDISTGRLPSNASINGISVTDNALFVVVLPTGGNIKFYKSTDQGSTYVEQTSTGLTFPMISNIIQVSTNGFIGNGLYNEVLYSTTGGSTWVASTTPFDAISAANLTLSGTALMFSVQNRGLLYSSNQGTSWSANNSNIPGFSGVAYFLNDLIAVKDTLFSFIQPTPYSQSVVLYKSSNHGTSWTASPIPYPYSKGTEYSFAGKCDSALFVNYYDSISSKFAVLTTFNNGNSWVKNNSANIYQLTYFKGSKNFLFAFTDNYGDYNDFSNVYKANNFGISYTDISNGIINGSFLIKRMEDSQGDKTEPIMDIDAPNNRAIFAITDHTLGNVYRLYLYNMASNAWSDLTPVGLPYNYVPNCIKYTGNNSWLLATNVGLYKSINGGVNWTITHNVNTWQNGITVNRIHIIGNTVFMGTLDDGIWTVNLATGFASPLSDNALIVYPNPGTGIMQVTIPDFTGKTAGVSLYSMDGKLMLQKTATDKQFELDIHNLASGNYLLLVNSNNRIYTKSIIRN
jgi:photosystem II stability/assembly factor-like uncharacterized protein